MRASHRAEFQFRHGQLADSRASRRSASIDHRRRGSEKRKSDVFTQTDLSVRLLKAQKRYDAGNDAASHSQLEFSILTWPIDPELDER